ncbi:MAG TPA: type III-A CRISPR-associated RAMP protein Csm4 [Thermoplasmata archaeon]|nr:type III-A CRISPR-associated RAMP protein Csm4 [Thermoplasmata archaeon]
MNEKIVYIRPKSIFPDLSSNTIFGAICSALKELYEGEPEEMIGKFKEKPPFLLSSAFPYTDGHLFFPMLIMHKKIPDEKLDKALEGAKELKDVRYVHKDIFNGLINGKLDLIELMTEVEKYKIERGFLMDKEVRIGIETAEVPHNMLNRLSSESLYFFHSGKLYKNSGLFFLIRFYDKSYEEKIEAALNFLEDRGFGGKISGGCGWFEHEIRDEKLIEEPEDGEILTTLSLYLPERDEFESFKRSNKIWYVPVRIIGRHRDGFMKKGVVMLKEGSTFGDIGREFYGRIAEVLDKVVEYGFAFKVRIREV